MTKNDLARSGQKSSVPNPNGNGKQYNWIYGELVNEADDVVGLIAYGLYKRRKIAFIKGFQDEHKRDPEDHELTHFHRGCLVHAQDYRDLAEKKMEEAFERLYEDILIEAGESYEQALARLAKEHDNELKERLKGTVAGNFWTSVVASLASAVIIGLLGLAWLGYNPEIVRALHLLVDLVTASGTSSP